MNRIFRGAAVLGLAAVLAAPAASQAPGATGAPAAAASRAPLTALTTQRQKVSYLVGTDVAQSIAPVAPDIDLVAFERAIRNAFDGGAPLITPEQARSTHEAIMQRIAARRGQSPTGAAPPEVSRAHVAALVGTDIGGSLKTIRDEIDLPVFMQAVATSFAGGPLLLDEAQRNALREEFSREVSGKLQARAAEEAAENRSAGEKFLARNRAQKGVYTTPSGLQYMVLRQGSGARPGPSDRVLVNYHGTLLDGTVFDSSYDRGGNPVDFRLDQVIRGWSEGVRMMPVGGKYRFWIPAELGYGERGAGPVGPNATLVFDVELLSITQ